MNVAWSRAWAPLLLDLRRGLPYALVLAVLLGAVLGIGAHYSNAFPSEGHPNGWPGPAHFENAVAMVRNDLVLAASVPALLLGARCLDGFEPSRDRGRRLLCAFTTQGVLLSTAAFAAGGIGAAVAFKTPFDAWLAFGTAHALLAVAFFALGFLWAAVLRRHALALAAAVWIFFLGCYEALVRTILFRTVGGEAVAAGQFPDWFWAAQAASPLSAYRGILILWRPSFRDYLEHAALDHASLPSFLVPGTFIALMLVLWVLVPLGIALAVWWVRGRVQVSRATSPSIVATRAPDRKIS